jgi:hypothetical protein
MEEEFQKWWDEKGFLLGTSKALRPIFEAGFMANDRAYREQG